MKVKRKEPYLRASPDNNLLSVRDQIKDEYSMFYLEAQSGDLFRISVDATGRYLRESPDDRLLSTRLQIDDDHTRFYIEKQDDSSNRIRRRKMYYVVCN